MCTRQIGKRDCRHFSCDRAEKSKLRANESLFCVRERHTTHSRQPLLASANSQPCLSNKRSQEQCFAHAFEPCVSLITNERKTRFSQNARNARSVAMGSPFESLFYRWQISKKWPQHTIAWPIATYREANVREDVQLSPDYAYVAYNHFEQSNFPTTKMNLTIRVNVMQMHTFRSPSRRCIESGCRCHRYRRYWLAASNAICSNRRVHCTVRG